MTDLQEKKSRFEMTCRRMILGGSLIGGALVVGYVAANPMQVADAILKGGGNDPEDSAFGPYIRITGDGWVTIVNKQQELGQGIHAGLAAIVSEELDADWDKVRVIEARSNFRIYGAQLTGGSNAIASNWDLMRNAGAAARSMFVEAAAQRWGVPREEIVVSDGVLSHLASNRTTTFVELLFEASRQQPRGPLQFKAPKAYRLIGTDRVRRKDSVPKSTGSQIYTQDIQRPEMLVAMVAHSPRFGGKLTRFDASDARKVKGVVDVFAIETGVAVVAQTTYAAWKSRDALRRVWDESEAEMRSTPDLVQFFQDVAAGNTELEPGSFQSTGDAPEASFAGDVAEFTFDFPYLAHAPMETLDCVAQVDGWDVSITSGAHLATIDQVQGALAARTIPGKVDIEVVPAGGSFGRRGVMSSDYLVECVRIAKHVEGRPVKLIWSREDEMASGYFRPMSHHRIWVEVGPDGFPTRWRFHCVCQSPLSVGPNATATEGITDSPYFSTAVTIDGKIFTPTFPVAVGFWRSVGHSHTVRIPMKPATDSEIKPASHSDFNPAAVPI